MVQYKIYKQDDEDREDLVGLDAPDDASQSSEANPAAPSGSMSNHNASNQYHTKYTASNQNPAAKVLCFEDGTLPARILNWIIINRILLLFLILLIFQISAMMALLSLNNTLHHAIDLALNRNNAENRIAGEKPKDAFFNETEVENMASVCDVIYCLGSKCYCVGSKPLMFMDANDVCQNKLIEGATLLQFNSRKEADRVMINDDTDRWEHYWTAATDQHKENDWRWLPSNKSVDVSIFNWRYSLKPDNWVGNKHCLLKENDYLIDMSCYVEKYKRYNTYRVDRRDIQMICELNTNTTFPKNSNVTLGNLKDNLGSQDNITDDQIELFKKSCETFRCVDRSCYCVSNDSRNSWDQGRTYCKRNLNMSDLVTFQSTNEQTFVLEKLTDKRAMIGASDYINEGDWKWFGGEGIPIEAFKWKVGFEPRAGEHCLTISGQGEMSDTSCSNTNYFICQFNKPKKTSNRKYSFETVENLAKMCDLFFCNPSTSHCYCEESKWDEWRSANDWCSFSYNGHLAVFEDVDEQQFVLSQKNKFRDDTWIGVTNFYDENRLDWITGEGIGLDKLALTENKLDKSDVLEMRCFAICTNPENKVIKKNCGEYIHSLCEYKFEDILNYSAE